MTYEEGIKWLYDRTPQFERIGAAAYKPGLQTTLLLASAFGNPQKRLRVVHVAGTNGKGSTSHTIAAVLQSAGYRTGLYTSPHLVDFRERMKIDGRMISKNDVIDFIARFNSLDLNIEPSFFELTTLMAFDWFAREHTDIVVVETGLGGRLDSTNIVDPILDVITNISKDHCAQLGESLREITYEKCGIMRAGITTVCGETDNKIIKYFQEEAQNHHCPIVFANTQMREVEFSVNKHSGMLDITQSPFGPISYQLTADYQIENARTVLTTITELRKLGLNITDEAVRRGFAEVCNLTGFSGRWTVFAHEPLCIADTGHNIGGWKMLAPQLDRMPRPLVIVVGFVADKDLTEILKLLPVDASYIVTQANIPRALNAEILAEKLQNVGIQVLSIQPKVYSAYTLARNITPPAGSIFVGGSTYVVADLFSSI